MSDTQPHYDLNWLIAALDEDLKALMEFASISPDHYTRVNQYLVSDLQSLRFNNLADMLSITDTWNPIRDNPPVVDLLLELTTNLQLNATVLHAEGWQKLTTMVGNAMGCFNHERVVAKDCVLDNDDERERYVTPKTAGTHLTSNPWLVTLFLLRRTPTVRKLIADLAVQAARSQRVAGTSPQAE